jgi:hypothetical protein
MKIRQTIAASAVVIATLSAAPAFAATITFSFSGTVQSSFIDVDNVYGFGVGANLTGDSVTDTYTIDTSSSTFSTGTIPGGSYNEYNPQFTGSSLATSDIDGHTVTLSPANGDQLTAYIQQISTPYDQTILELQAIGIETTGTAIGSEFLIRDEIVSYSLTGLPLSLVSPTGGYTLSPTSLTAAGAWEYGGVNFSYAPGASPGFFGVVGIPGVPEPATWAMFLVGFGAVGFAMRRSLRNVAVPFA